MSKVQFTYGKGGRTVLMARRYAETLRKLGHGTYPAAVEEKGGNTSPFDYAPFKTPEAEILISEAVAAFAKENGIDIKTVVGTGKDGRINKSDIESAIKAQDLA